MTNTPVLHDPPQLARLVVGRLPNPKALRLSMEGLRIGFVVVAAYILCLLE